MKKNLTALIIVVTVLILTLVSFFGVWYNAHVSIISGTNMVGVDDSFYLTKGDVVTQDLKTGTSTSNTYNYNDMELILDSLNSPLIPSGIFGMYNIVFYLMIIIFLISVMTLICCLWFVIHNNNLIRNVVAILSVVLCVFSFLTIVYFALQYEFLQRDTLENFGNLVTDFTGNADFWSNAVYTVESPQMSVSYHSGPGYAWYLMIVIGILSMISYSVIIKKSDEKLPINNAKNKSVNQQPHLIQPQPIQQSPTREFFCPNCGTKLDGFPAFCFKCGYKLR